MAREFTLRVRLTEDEKLRLKAEAEKRGKLEAMKSMRKTAL